MPKLYHLLFILISFLDNASCLGQNNELQNIHSQRIFLNKKENSFLLFDDSTYYFEFKISRGKWEKRPYIFQGECSFKEFQIKFIPMAIENGEILFVYHGVGEVYGLKNDTLKRIDRSFRHENQFGGNIFTYKNKIFCFGGYGLFTFKNFISYYNLNFKEWIVDDIPSRFKTPAPRVDSYCQQFGNQLYVMGGNCTNSKETNTYKDVWRYSIGNNHWNMIGILNPNGIMPIFWARFDAEQANSKLIRKEDYLYLVDIEKNKVTTFYSEDFKLLKHPLFDVTEKYICAIIQKSDFDISAVVYNKNVILGKPVKSVDLYLPLIDGPENDSKIRLIIIIISSFSLLGLIFLFIRRRKRKGFNLLHKRNGEYYLYDQKLFTLFNSIDFAVIMKFLYAENNSLEIADINSIVEYDNASFDAVKKRREQSLKNIREKLALYGKIPLEDVFISSQHPQDRRIKLLQLNPKLIIN